MINLDQVRTLEWKVKQAVQLIVHLRRENDTLRGRLSDTEVRLQELEALLESFKANQNEMESGIRSALEELDHLEAGEAPAATPGPVDSLSYPPTEVAAVVAEATPAVDEPVEPSFEEEYAALAAAEAEALAAAHEEVEPEPEPEAEIASAPVPESVELEGSLPPSVPEEDDSFLFEESADVEPQSEPEPVVPEEKQPEQPGLGIF